MVRCNGNGYPGCKSCVNRESDPFECDECEDESHWEGDECEDKSHWEGDDFDDDFDDDDDDFSMLDIARRIPEDALT